MLLLLSFFPRRYLVTTHLGIIDNLILIRMYASVQITNPSESENVIFDGHGQKVCPQLVHPFPVPKSQIPICRYDALFSYEQSSSKLSIF
jgi:hypothetical protein